MKHDHINMQYESVDALEDLISAADTKAESDQRALLASIKP